MINSNESRIAKPIILPSSHTGSRRNMQNNYLDALAIVRAVGKADLWLQLYGMKSNLFEHKTGLILFQSKIKEWILKRIFLEH